jgi:hypothetical protein
MSIPGRDSTAAMLARAGFVAVLVPVNVSGFRLILARGWHGQTSSISENAMSRLRFRISITSWSKWSIALRRRPSLSASIVTQLVTRFLEGPRPRATARLTLDNGGMTSDPNPSNILKDRQIALGQVIEHSASMEYTLRNAFCSLVDSKYAAIVAGGQAVNWPVDQCKALTDAHHDMPVEHQAAIKAALEACRVANERRNHLVHGVKTASRVSNGSLQTMKSKQRSYTSVIQPWTPATIQEPPRSCSKPIWPSLPRCRKP